MIESGHCGEVFPWDISAMILKDKAISVARISNNDNLDVSVGIVIYISSGFDEVLSIVL